MLIKFPKSIQLPNGGWTHAYVLGERNGRTLIELSGSSGHSKVSRELFTIDSDAITAKKGAWVTYAVEIKPGTYQVEVTKDRRGNRLVRFRKIENADSDQVGVVIEKDKPKDREALLFVEGFSRSGRNWDKWALIVGKEGEIVECDGGFYEIRDGKAVYLGDVDPREW